jgi:hypothetical protein
MTPERELEELIYDHLAEDYPEAFTDLDDDQIHRRIRAGISRARGHALDTDGAAVAFVTLMFLVAPDFDRNPAIRSALSAAGVPADSRISRMFESTTEDDWADAADQSGGWDEAAGK